MPAVSSAKARAGSTRSHPAARLPGRAHSDSGARVEGDDEAWVQLATRIPKSLHRKLKLHTVVAETTVMAFVVEAIEQKLACEEGKRRKRP